MGILKSIGKAIGSVASPLISGAFGIGSSLLNNKAQSDANKTNMQIAQMNNQWSEKMMEKQHMYDLEARQYNEASNQRKRLEQAGLNPSLMMNGGSAGIAQGSSVGMPSPTTPNIQPLRYDGFSNAISNTMQLLMAQSKNDAEVGKLEAEKDYIDAMARVKTREIEENTRGSKWRNDFNERNQDYHDLNLGEEYLGRVQKRTNESLQQQLLDQHIIAQRLINENLPEELAMRIAVQASIRDLNRKNIDSVAEDIVRQSLESEKIKYSPKQIERLKEATISAIEASIGQGWLNAGVNAVTSTLDAVSTFGGKKTPKSYHNHSHYTSIYNR